MNFANRAAQLSDTIIADRRYLHQHAELSFEEHETTAYLVSEMEKLGIPVQTFEDYTGCIATIKGGKPGKTHKTAREFSHHAHFTSPSRFAVILSNIRKLANPYCGRGWVFAVATETL